MARPVTAYVGLGANLGGGPQALVDTLALALRRMDALPGSQVLSCSSFYRTAPFEAAGPDFVNAVAALGTTLGPLDLLHGLQGIEAQAGRERPYRNAPRTLDLDLLLYGDLAMASDELTLPHPRMHRRAFVLVPLAEIAPDRVSPAELAALKDQAIEQLPTQPWQRGGRSGGAGGTEP